MRIKVALLHVLCIILAITVETMSLLYPHGIWEDEVIYFSYRSFEDSLLIDGFFLAIFILGSVLSAILLLRGRDIAVISFFSMGTMQVFFVLFHIYIFWRMTMTGYLFLSIGLTQILFSWYFYTRNLTRKRS